MDNQHRIEVHQGDHTWVGTVQITIREGTNYVDVAIRNATGYEHEMSFMIDSLERQLPSALRAAGMLEDQIDSEIEKTIDWAVEATGGEKHFYDVRDGEVVVHMINYRDGEMTRFPMGIWEDGTVYHLASEVVKPDNASFAVVQDGIYQRATISRVGFPTHVVMFQRAPDAV